MSILNRNTIGRMNIRPSKVVFYRIFKKYADSVEKQSTVLDIASARFKNAPFLKHTYYIGADIDFNRLSQARSRNPQPAVQCNILRPPFKPESFTNVICTHTLSHISNNEQILAAVSGISGLVSPGGQLFFNLEPQGDLESGLDRFLKRRFSSIRKHRYKNSLTASWEELAVNAKRMQRFLLPVAFFISLLDSVGTGKRIIYVCGGSR